MDEKKNRRRCERALGKAAKLLPKLPLQNAPAQALGSGVPMAAAPAAGKFKNTATDDPASDAVSRKRKHLLKLRANTDR